MRPVLLVLAFCHFSAVATEELATFNFPIFVRVDDDNYVHQDETQCSKFESNEDMCLEQLRDICTEYNYIELINRDSSDFQLEVCCTNATKRKDVNNFSLLPQSIPYLAFPSTVGSNGTLIYVGTPAGDEVSQVSTIYQVHPSSGQPDLKFFGCFDVKTLGSLEDECGKQFYLENGEIWSTSFHKRSLRVWDLVPGCLRTWHPWPPCDSDEVVPIDGPVGYWDETRAVYDAGCVSFAPSVPDPESEADIDILHFQAARCFHGSQIKKGVMFDNYYGSIQCVYHCKNLGFEFAFVSPLRCGCLWLSDLPIIMKFHGNDHAQCKPCPGESNSTCGDVNGGEEFVSLYDIQETQAGFSYWQCVNLDLVNPFKESDNPSDFYKSAKTTNASLCAEYCENFELVVISSYEYDETLCQCLNYYKFKMEDIRSSCVRTWCPGFDGPCISTDDKPVDQAVYCNERIVKDCGANFLLPNSQSSICVEGEVRPIPNKGDCYGTYVECRLDRVAGRSNWEVVQCPNEQFFSIKHNSCSAACGSNGKFSFLKKKNHRRCCLSLRAPSVFRKSKLSDIFFAIDCRHDPGHCNCKDDAGVTWRVPMNVLGVKDCPQPSVGNETWFCSDQGVFQTEVPDRSGCRMDTHCDFSNPQVCNCTDDHELRWIVDLNQIGTKPCPETFQGDQTWECGGFGKFVTEHPNRDFCIEQWITDIDNSVSLK